MHAPCPLHVASPVKALTSQTAAPHTVEELLANAAQLVVWSTTPSHVRARHGSPPPVSHCARAPWGAPWTGLHEPTLPTTSHASHWPAQARSQHTPSTHAL